MTEPDPARARPTPRLAVLVPVKQFTAAKERLAQHLSPAERAELARRLADGVVAAAAPHPVYVCCDDDEVREWALLRGHRVSWTPGHDLNGAVEFATEEAAAAGFDLVAVVHADLPFPAELPEIASRATRSTVVIVPDRHRDGTNVLVIPTDAHWRFGYGPGSLERHLEEARRLELEIEIVTHEALGWDVDHPEDLDPPAHLGTPMWDRADA